MLVPTMVKVVFQIHYQIQYFVLTPKRGGLITEIKIIIKELFTCGLIGTPNSHQIRSKYKK